MAGYCPIDGGLLLEAPSSVVVAAGDGCSAILAGEDDGAVVGVVTDFPDTCRGPDAGLVAVGVVDGGKMFFSPGNLRVLVKTVGIVGYFLFQFPDCFAVADVVVGIDKASSPADPVFDQLAAAVVGEVSGGCRCGDIPGVPALDGTPQGVIIVLMAAR